MNEKVITHPLLGVVDVIKVSDEAFDNITKILEDSKTQEPSQALKDLMARKPGWTAAETKIKPTPQIGQVCMIRHQVKRAGNGDTLGLQRADGKPVRAVITAVYLDGSVRTGISDTWEVQPANTGVWETVNPFHGKGE